MNLTEGSKTFPRDWVDPKHTALLSMEMQRGVVGDLSRIAVLVEAVKADNVVANLAALMKAARAAGVQVAHCSALATRLRCDSIAPFGTPVVPPVYCSSATESAGGAASA